MKRFFLAHIIPQDKVKNYHVAQASHNFSYNLIYSGLFDEVYSIVPPNIRGRKESFVDSNYKLVYSCLRKHKHMSKIASVLEQIKLFFFLKEECNLWLYNISPSNFILVVLLLLFKPQINLFCIVLDFTPGTMFSKMMLSLINQCKGLIKLSNSDLFSVSNAICLPGIVPDFSLHDEIGIPIGRSFLLSGVLYEHISMLSIVLDCFSKLPYCTLYITGFGGNEVLINKYITSYKNINYLGKVEYEAFVEVLKKCPFVLSTRDISYPENACNFPSKILEALLYNRIILSTIKYDQIDGVNYFLLPQESSLMFESIKQISEMPDSKLLQYANQEKLVKKKFSPQVWKNALSLIENNSI